MSPPRSALVCAVLLASSSATLHALEPRAVTPVLEARECVDVPAPLAGRLSCKLLVVPLDRSRADSAAAHIPVAVLAPETPSDEPPILYLQGGKGAGYGLPFRRPALAAELARSRAVIFFDHRGAGRSTPKLRCAGIASLDMDIRIVDRALAARTELRQALAGCVEGLRRAGVDPHLFGLDDNARDLEDLRRLLAIPQWDIYAISYGTLQADFLLYIGRQHIRRVVMDGAVDRHFDEDAPDAQFNSLLRIFDECAAETACDAAYPELERKYFGIIRGLGDGGSAATASARDFHRLLRLASFSAASRGAVPAMVELAARGQMAAARARFIEQPANPGPDDSLIDFVQACRFALYRPERPMTPSPALREIPADVKRLVASGTRAGMIPNCEAMGLRPATAQTMAPRAPMDVPVLFLDGEVDGVTPPDFAVNIAKGYLRTDSLLFPLTPHWVLAAHPQCAGAITRRFLDVGSIEGATACISSLPRTRWDLITGN